MIDKNKFYDKDDIPGILTKTKMWNSIKREMKGKERKFFPGIEFKSFSFGIAAAVIAFFTFMGVKATFSNFLESKRPVNERVNRVYLEAINKFEKTLPIVLANKSKSQIDDDLISVRKEQLETINAAISEFKSSQKMPDNSRIKQSRLRELYKMKLEILNEIIAMEENVL